MSDSAQIVVRDGGSSVYLETQYNGTELPELVRAGLFAASEADKLNDGPVLTRVLFCQMVVADGDVLDTTGYGISGYPANVGREIVIDVTDQTIEGDDYGIDLQSIKDFLGGLVDDGDDEDTDEDEEPAY